jgi:hypothetical protein
MTQVSFFFSFNLYAVFPWMEGRQWCMYKYELVWIIFVVWPVQENGVLDF